MTKIMNKKELKQLFNSHPSVDVFYFTSNGYSFAKEHHAIDHARDLGDNKVEVIKRSDVFGSTTGEEKPLTAAEVIEAIKAAKSIEELEAALPEDESRKSVLAAYETRKSEQWPDPEEYK